VNKLDSIPIKVVNVTRKRDSYVTYMLNLNIESLHKLKDLHKHILDQLGKGIASYDLLLVQPWLA